MQGGSVTWCLASLCVTSEPRRVCPRALGKQSGVSFTYVSKIENEKLDFGDHSSKLSICRIAGVLEADRDELLLFEKNSRN